MLTRKYLVHLESAWPGMDQADVDRVHKKFLEFIRSPESYGVLPGSVKVVVREVGNPLSTQPHPPLLKPSNHPS